MLNKLINKIGSIFRKTEKTTLEKHADKKSEKSQEKSSARKNRPQNKKNDKRRPDEKYNNKRTHKKEQNKPKEKPKVPKKTVKTDPQWTLDNFQVPEKEGETRFHDLDLPTSVMHAIADLGFKYCTPIQAGTLPHTLKGKDCTGKAQTGTGKTAAFLITILTHIIRRKKSNRKAGYPRALIIAPTRELVLQIEKDVRGLTKHTNIRAIAVFGGMDYRKQKNKLRSQIADIIIATPGRLLDFKKNNDIYLNQVEILVIDEADRMLDMGFIPDVRTIVKSTPYKDKRQTLFFSATISTDVERLAGSWTRDPITVSVDPDEVAAESVDQRMYLVSNDEKYTMLYNTIKKNNLDKVMVFCNRKDEAKDVYIKLYKNGIICEQLSGDVDQRKRLKILEDFKSGKINVMIATDVAGRGIHIKGVSHVINYSLPENPEDYVHRIGRTGRAGQSGISIGFASEDDSFAIPAIEKFIDRKLELLHPEDELLESPPAPEREYIDKPQQKKKYYPKNSHRGNYNNNKGNRKPNNNNR